MAFAEPPDNDLLTILTANSSSSSSGWAESINLLRRSTLGLTQLFTEISAAKSFGGTVSLRQESHSDSTGRLNIGESNPILGKRYRLVEQIGEGSFSQIYKALDTYSGTHVAIKILKVGMDLMGDRETRFLQYFRTKEVRGAQHFVHVLDTFRFEKHLCIVQHLYDTTLLSLLVMPDMRPADEPQPTSSSSSDRFRSVLHQPRVVRTTFLSNSPLLSFTGSSTVSAAPAADQIVQLRRGTMSPRLTPPVTVTPYYRYLHLICSIFLSPPLSLADSHLHSSLTLPPLPHSTVGEINKLRRIATSLLSALCMMRKEGAIHADIKPENCFLQLTDNNGMNNNTNTNSSNNNNNSSNNNSSSNNNNNVHVHEGLASLPDSFELRLGDYGNSIHISEIANYYVDFDMQTLPYRAPEVLLGVPFGYQIDMWSLGILLVEVCIGKPLFVVRTREELYDALCSKLSAPPRVRFAGEMHPQHSL